MGVRVGVAGGRADDAEEAQSVGQSVKGATACLRPSARADARLGSGRGRVRWAGAAGPQLPCASGETGKIHFGCRWAGRARGPTAWKLGPRRGRGGVVAASWSWRPWQQRAIAAIAGVVAGIGQSCGGRPLCHGPRAPREACKGAQGNSRRWPASRSQQGAGACCVLWVACLWPGLACCCSPRLFCGPGRQGVAMSQPSRLPSVLQQKAGKEGASAGRRRRRLAPTTPAADGRRTAQDTSRRAARAQRRTARDSWRRPARADVVRAAALRLRASRPAPLWPDAWRQTGHDDSHAPLYPLLPLRA